MLDSPFRHYVITKIKDHIRKALESGRTMVEVMGEVGRSMSRLPRIGRGNLQKPSTLCVKDKVDVLLDYHHNPQREAMLNQAAKLLISEYEHDDYYAFFLDAFMVEMAIEIANGKFKPRRLKFPFPACWSGPDILDMKTVRERMREALHEQLDS